MIHDGKELVIEIQKKVNSRLCELTSDIDRDQNGIRRMQQEQKRLREIYELLNNDPEYAGVIAHAIKEGMIVCGEQRK